MLKAFADVFSYFFDFLESLPSLGWEVALIFVIIFLLLPIFYTLCLYLGLLDPYEHPDLPPDIPPPDFPNKLQVKIADFFCRWRWGFKLMYFLGWAVHGRHFVDSGQDPDDDQS